MVQGRDDLLECPDEPVRRVLGALLAGVGSVAESINQFPPGQFASLRVEARAWYTIVKPDGFLPSTQYPNTSWLAVYCAAAPALAPCTTPSGDSLASRT